MIHDEKEIVDEIKTWGLCNRLFKDDSGEPLMLTDYQLEIVDIIFRKKYPKTLCWATTRAGKSLAVAIGLILRALFYKGERIRIIAPTSEHTRIVMGYVIQHILDNKIIIGSLEFDTKGMGAERLKKELSRNRIVFDNGSEIRILTANVHGDGRSLVGFGGTCIVVDEAENIPSEIIRTKVMRMLGDTRNPLIFLISNPVLKGYMYDSMKDESWKQIVIDWKKCVSEGRLSKEFVDERRKEMTDIEFKIWYDAVYPEEGEDTLIPWSWIQESKEKNIERNPDSKIYLGVDVARMGSDSTVYTVVEKTPEGYFSVRDIKVKNKQDTMKTCGDILNLDSKYDFNQVIIDETGLGGGVVDRLREQDIGYRIKGVNFGQSVEENESKKRFLNAKSEMYFNLRELFENRKIFIPENVKLLDQLNKLRYEFTSNGKIRIIDPEGKSPDEADSLALACYVHEHSIVFDMGL